MLAVQWQDRGCRFPFAFLRRKCGCAHCVDEWTGKQLLDPRTIAEDISLENIELVGNYAIRIYWSDGHSAGLYTWERLRELSELVPHT